MEKNAPPPPDAALQEAIALHQRGQLEQAAALYLAILEREPDNFDALHLLGVFALQSDDAQAACDLIGRALTLRPRDVPAHANLGLALQKLQRWDAALLCYQEALQIDPGHLQALNNCGATLRQMRRLDEAQACFERALRSAPADPDALNNLGQVLIEQGRYDAALACLERALGVAPDHVAALFNRANALQYQNRLGEALLAYQDVLRIAPAHVDANFNEGVCRLLGGDFDGGWPKYEWRREKDAYLPLKRAFPQAPWLGQPNLRGKTILVYAEQGLGDTLHFCRYVAPLAALGAQVVLRVQPALLPLLGGLDGAWRVLADGAPLPPFDYHCPLMSLALALHTTPSTIPAPRSYLSADSARARAWQARLGRRDKPRIGIAWAGSAAHANDRRRSIALQQLLGLVSPQAQFVALQKELGPLDRTLLDQHRDILHFGQFQGDFAETAALVAEMDLVITVDTALAHLAGAMGKPVWILLPFAPDWRWMLERDDSPWYRSATLFRQPAGGDWDSVLARVGAQLQALAAP
ncbi:Flp pilus assembly protein TadD [Oxalobacteraceae bacterium GrIS 1.11]